jgi:hypothetical protein
LDGHGHVSDLLAEKIETVIFVILKRVIRKGWMLIEIENV